MNHMKMVMSNAAVAACVSTQEGSLYPVTSDL